MWYIALFLLLITCLFYPIETFKSEKDVLVVVARYNESLEWMKDPPFSSYNILVYNKGINHDFYSPGKVSNLKNVGREGHTYLHHIVKNYDHLNDITIFLPGSLDMPHKMEKGKRMMAEIEKRQKAVFLSESDKVSTLYDFTISEYHSTSSENNDINQESKLDLANVRPFGKWWQDKFGKDALTHYSYCGILSVSKKDVLQNSRSYYEELLEELSHSSNPEVGHYVERSWQAIFNMKDTILL